MGRRIAMYDGKVFGVRVSGYGLDNGYLDYQALAGIVGDMILNNEIRSATFSGDWELVCGEDYHENEDGEIVDQVTVYQDYIISESGYEFLANYTDELVFYNHELDLYIWGITHWGTAWSHVLTNVKLVEGNC